MNNFSKKTIFVLLAFFSFFATALFASFFNEQPQSAFAKQGESKYLRVTNEQSVFYKDQNFQEPMFFLPYTYYVKVINEIEGGYHVEIGGGDFTSLDGYVLESGLFEDGLDVSSPYPQIYLTTLSTALLYEDANSSSAIQYVFKNRQLTFYGSYINEFDKQVYLVGYNGKLGYVAEECVEPFSIPNHPNELTFIKPSDSNGVDGGNVNAEGNQGKKNNGNLIIKIIIIGCLLFAGIIALYIALRPKKDKRNSSGYYDENDFE